MPVHTAVLQIQITPEISLDPTKPHPVQNVSRNTAAGLYRQQVNDVRPKYCWFSMLFTPEVTPASGRHRPDESTSSIAPKWFVNLIIFCKCIFGLQSSVPVTDFRMTEIRDIWRDYGFSKNPYHTEPLEPTESDSALYVRRQEAETRLGRFLVSEEAGGIFVEGKIGLGKTTFVNQTQYRIQSDDDLPTVLTSTALVEILEETTPRAFVLDILTAVLKALRAQSEGVEGTAEFQELERYSRKALIESWSGGGTVMGVGAEAGREVTPTDPPELTLQTLQDLLDTAAELAEDRGFEKIVVLINNLDNVDDQYFFGLLHDLRDTLLGRAPYLFVFSSPVGLRHELATTRAHRRISERIASETVELEPLTLDQVHRVIAKRLDAYRLEEEAGPPVPERVVDILYEASDGEIRYVLNRADGVARKVADSVASSARMDEELAFAALADIVRSEIESLDLTERKWEVLELVAKEETVQPKDFEQFDFNSSQGFTNYLTEFHEMKLLERSREGRETFYTPRGDVRLYFSDPTGW